MLDLAVIIVTWNVRDLALQTLESLYADLAGSKLNTEVIVVDSASSDDTVEAIREHYPQTTVIASETNLGFAKGNNTALRRLGFGGNSVDELPRAVYLLNPDTITQPNATQTLYHVLFTDEKVGVVGARLTYGDGSFQHGAFAFPGLCQLWVEFLPTPGRLIEHPFNGRYPRSLYESGQPFDVDFTLGATMMLKREVIQHTGMFDENFFMYVEEVDWAWRIRKAGWKIQCVPEAHVVHLGGQSTGQVRPRSTINLWQSRLLLFKKHYPQWKQFLAKQLIIIGMQRKIRQAENDASLSAEDRKVIIDAYQTVIHSAKER